MISESDKVCSLKTSVTILSRFEKGFLLVLSGVKVGINLQFFVKKCQKKFKIFKAIHKAKNPEKHKISLNFYNNYYAFTKLVTTAYCLKASCPRQPLFLGQFRPIV